MRLHALGWKSIFHSEILAYGLAPEDLASALSQRLRWAQGTLQILIRENPLFKKGLSPGQRVQYLTTMFSYFGGFVSLIYLAAPIIYLTTGIAPISEWSTAFFERFLPYTILNIAVFRAVSWGIRVKKGQQYALALFPLLIRAVLTVFTGAKLSFVVTPKHRQSRVSLRLVIPQLIVLAGTAIAMIFGVISYAIGGRVVLAGLVINLFWGIYNIRSLSTIVRAVFYRPPEGWNPKPPETADTR